MKQYWKACLVLAAVVGLSACAGKVYPPSVTTHNYSQGDAIQLWVPRTNGIGEKLSHQQEIFSRLGNVEFNRGQQSARESLNMWTQGASDQLRVQRRRCAIDKDVRGECAAPAYAEYDMTGMSAMRTRDQLSILVLMPTWSKLSRSVSEPGRQHYPEWSYDIKDFHAQLSEAEYAWDFEVESVYTPEAIYGNLLSALRHKKVSALRATPTAATGQINQGYLEVEVDGQVARVAFDILPYRSGARVIFKTQSKPYVRGQIIDFESMIRKIEARLKRVVWS